MNSLILHSIIVLHYIIVWTVGMIPFLCEFMRIDDEKAKQLIVICFGAMTMWNLTFHTITFAGYLVYDILEVRQICASFRTKLKRHLDKFFYSIVVSKTTLVVIFFWTLCSIDIGLVYPYSDIIADIFPSWADHAIHTTILPVVLLQVYHNKVSPLKYSVSKKNLLMLEVFYVACLYGTHFRTNFWIYPFLNYLYEPFRLFFFMIMIAGVSGIHFVFYHLNEWYCSTGAEGKIHKSN